MALKRKNQGYFPHFVCFARKELQSRAGADLPGVKSLIERSGFTASVPGVGSGPGLAQTAA
ncbi:MAG: hypothetical protein EBX44_11915 [Betaproteobacteria bacterium]|nr:hypothetical protein [Betaproteobacteria bacterium]NDC86464.1 hypothetical protein [Betaproteobacteria bacterium]NDG82485.1 hypothetical protein [Betaproteobacteria bacterium]